MAGLGIFPVDLPPRVPERSRLAKRIIACLDVRSDDEERLVVTQGLQYDMREGGRVRDMGDPVELAHCYYREGTHEITFQNQVETLFTDLGFEIFSVSPGFAGALHPPEGGWISSV